MIAARLNGPKLICCRTRTRTNQIGFNKISSYKLLGIDLGTILLHFVTLINRFHSLFETLLRDKCSQYWHGDSEQFRSYVQICRAGENSDVPRNPRSSCVALHQQTKFQHFISAYLKRKTERHRIQKTHVPMYFTFHTDLTPSEKTKENAKELLQ